LTARSIRASADAPKPGALDHPVMPQPVSAREPLLCRLQDAAGRVEACPEDRCPFWEPGGAVLDGRCAFEQRDFSGRPEVAGRLLRVRKRLDSPSTQAEEQEARRLFYRLLNDAGE